MNWRPAWTTQKIQGQPGLRSKTLSQIKSLPRPTPGLWVSGTARGQHERVWIQFLSLQNKQKCQSLLALILKPKNMLATQNCYNKILQVDGIKQKFLFSCRMSGGWESKVEKSADLVAFKGSFVSLKMASSLCVICVLIFSSYKEINHTGLELTVMTYLKLMKGPFF